MYCDVTKQLFPEEYCVCVHMHICVYVCSITSKFITGSVDVY